MLALGRRFGCAPAFLTFGIDDINNPNAIRLALRSSSNTEFPAVVSSASHVEMDRGIALEDEHEGVIRIPHGYTENDSNLMNNNPLELLLLISRLCMILWRYLMG